MYVRGSSCIAQSSKHPSGQSLYRRGFRVLALSKKGSEGLHIRCVWEPLSFCKASDLPQNRRHLSLDHGQQCARKSEDPPKRFSTREEVKAHWSGGEQVRGRFQESFCTKAQTSQIQLLATPIPLLGLFVSLLERVYIYIYTYLHMNRFTFAYCLYPCWFESAIGQWLPTSGQSSQPQS